MLGALQSGLFSAAAAKISDVVVSLIVDEEPPADTPTEKPRKDGQRRTTNRSD